MAQLFTDQSISIYQTQIKENRQVVSAKVASHVQYKVWENHDLTVKPAFTYIYLCG